MSRGNKRAVKELINWEKHWEQGRANEADTRRVERKKIRLGRSTGTLEGNRTLGTQ